MSRKKSTAESNQKLWDIVIPLFLIRLRTVLGSFSVPKDPAPLGTITKSSVIIQLYCSVKTIRYDMTKLVSGTSED